MTLRKKIGWDELEREANIDRTEFRAPTRNDIRRIERKVLGPLWGKKRRQFQGPR